MPWNHVALATKDLDATHRFYTEVMGFRLAKVVVAPTPDATGWARHVFYDCGGGQFIAFWDLHDPTITDYPTDLSESIGLPGWVNHLAWDGTDEETYQAHLRRWRAHGHTVAEVDHGFCKSIYIADPNGIMVEFCLMTAGLGPADEAEGLRLIAEEAPALTEPPEVVFHEPLTTANR
ncbi:MAG TPA: VOC family protein [Acidimicrobiia bacterium]|nr:VOC family protein [Acidimicrobiia bacterium]